MKMASLYDTVTNNIVAELEKGVAPWVQPWKTSRRTKLGLLPGNAATRRTYSGINIPILWQAAIRTAIRSRVDDLQAGARPRSERPQGRARHACRVHQADRRGRRHREAIACCASTPSSMSRRSTACPSGSSLPKSRRSAAGRRSLHREHERRYPARRSKACFVPSLDFVNLPPRNAFKSIEPFYATALHELGHYAAFRIMPRTGRKAWGLRLMISA